jgi:hypothetical protein
MATKKNQKITGTKSFRVGKEPKPFMTFRITGQTIYWSILLAYIMALSLWVLKIYTDTQTILDSIR